MKVSGIILLMALSLHADTFAANPVDIKYAGCVTIMENLMKDAKIVFEKNTGTSICLSGYGAEACIRAVLSGLVNTGGVPGALNKGKELFGLSGRPVNS